jgi:hypothetical protein
MYQNRIESMQNIRFSMVSECEQIIGIKSKQYDRRTPTIYLFSTISRVLKLLLAGPVPGPVTIAGFFGGSSPQAAASRTALQKESHHQ